jgi:hypothetical protein
VANGHGARSWACDIAMFVALLSTAIALGAALAHLLELPHKIDLPRDQYFIVQSIYRGWNRLGVILFIELLSILTLIALSTRRGPVFWPAIAALLCLLAEQALFWLYTFPANVATANWTVIPQDWEQLRRQWEFSHAGGALLQLGAMIALIIASIFRAHPAYVEGPEAAPRPENDTGAPVKNPR